VRNGEFRNDLGYTDTLAALHHTGFIAQTFHAMLAEG
jgi:hypothetical protein